MVNDEDLKEFVEKEKEINQAGTIDESVTEHLGSMGWLWDSVIKKLNTDRTCFDCKKTVNLEAGENIQVAEASGVEKGVCAFVGLCPDCSKKLDKKGEIDVKNK